MGDLSASHHFLSDAASVQVCVRQLSNAAECNWALLCSEWCGHSGDLGHVRMVASCHIFTIPYLVCLITVRVLNKSRLTVIDGGDWSLSCGH
jgi:hypothetical protein